MPGAPSPALTRTVAMLALVAATACSAPSNDRRRTAWQSAQRVLGIDLGDTAMTRRVERLERLPAMFTKEWHRTAGIAGELSAAVPDEGARLTAAVRRAETWWSAEARRRPHVPAPVLPTAYAFGQELADDLQHLGELLTGPRPLPEIEDRDHRTDPQDTHPEATWWQRLRRRLWL